MNPQRLYSWAEAMNKMGRPFVTAIVTVIYNVALLIALAMGSLDVKEYILAVGPTNAMIIGFWFARRENSADQETEETPK